MTDDLLQAEFEFGYTYTRTTGPVIGHFLHQLKNRSMVGIRGSKGQVIVPPMEYDPETAEELSEFVPLASSGSVVSYSWVHQPRPRHLLQHPFAWALIQFDGADTSLLHMVDAGAEQNITIGSRVNVRWAAETRGHITDIACFELENS
ncbi:MAG: Zn-ribbon domain-containing OB-fold protein [Pseudomonadales bacterium]